MPGKQSFNWVFTLNNYTEQEVSTIPEWLEKGAGGVAYAHEIGASGTPHLQGYVHMKAKSSMKKMKEICKRCHWEVMKGKLADSEKYCSKQGQLIVLGKDPAAPETGGCVRLRRTHLYAHEALRATLCRSYSWMVLGFIGTMPTKESETSGGLLELTEEIKKGNHDRRDLFTKYGPVYTRVYRGIDHCINLVKKPKPYQRKERPKNCIWFGKAGSGKTWDAEQTAIDAELSMFKIPMRQLKQGWYDGYAGEEIILFDDFRGSSMEPHEFLNLLDGLDRLPVKRDYVNNNANHLFFTSSDHPINWWPKWYSKDPNNWAQVRRRLDKIYIAQEHQVSNVDIDEYKIYQTEIETVKIR